MNTRTDGSIGPSTVGQLEAFHQHRSRLFAIAYRMLGSVMDAEDMVQDTFLRWQKQSAQGIQSTQAYLTTILTRLCIDHLRSARVQREQYIGPWLPEPLITDSSADPSAMAELSDSLAIAFLVMLERLSPVERAVFLLKDVFDYSFDEISLMVEKSSVNCRQIARRSRQRLSLEKSRFQTTPEAKEKLTQQFINAFTHGDLDGLLKILADDVTVWSDGGGKVVAALKPLHGAQKVARFLRAIERRKQQQSWSDETKRVEINGQPGLIYFSDRGISSVLSLEFVEDKISALYFVRNPDKFQGCCTMR